MVLLTSEKYIKENSGLDDNLFGKFLLPAMKEAQEIGLQQIIGTKLYKSLQKKIKDNTIRENEKYEMLLNLYIQPYLKYRVLTDIIPIIGSKLSNMGAVISNDEHIVHLGETEKANLMEYWGFRANFYCKRMQEFILEYRDDFVEVDEKCCNQINANLYSMSDCGIWLGGIRGRK